MERLLLAISTFAFLSGFAYTMYTLGARSYRHTQFNFFANLFGFLCQTGFLYLRGQEVGRCPLTTLFDVLAFLCWSMVFFYLVIGPAYRLSLMGAFTAPLVCVL
jgi:ABC-type transport system involved in cytochrome c biogenesis permease subunit